MVCKVLCLVGSFGLAVSTTFVSIAVAESNFAQVQNVQGKVLINQGRGFVAALDDPMLKPGDKIMVGKEASAVVKYSNGCEITVSEPKVLTIAKSAPCPAGAKIASVGANLATPVDGGGGDGLPPAAVGLGAFGIVFGAAIIAETTRAKPISAP